MKYRATLASDAKKRVNEESEARTNGMNQLFSTWVEGILIYVYGRETKLEHPINKNPSVIKGHKQQSTATDHLNTSS